MARELDEEIGALRARGDLDGAAARALDALGPAIFGWLCSMLDEDDAKDVFSTFSEDLWRGLAAFRGEASIKTWAYRLAWNAACRFRRDPWRRRRDGIPESAASRLAASIASRSGLAPGSRLERLNRLRASLAPEEQALLVLRLDRELEWEEIAAILSEEAPVAAATLRKRFERLKEKLAGMARAEGLLD